MRIMLDSAATPLLPISMLSSPVVRLAPALAPNAMLPLPVVFKSAASPMAVLASPMMLLESELLPKALLLNPVVFRTSAKVPTALLKLPSPSFAPPVLLNSASTPTAVF